MDTAECLPCKDLIELDAALLVPRKHGAGRTRAGMEERTYTSLRFSRAHVLERIYDCRWEAHMWARAGIVSDELSEVDCRRVAFWA